MDMNQNDITRFWKKVDRSSPDNCWNWISSTARGYGLFSLLGKLRMAHRVSYEMHHEKIPEGKIVRHTCDNPRCVNPSHLIVGTSKENTAEAAARGRLRRNSHNRLTEALDQTGYTRKWIGENVLGIGFQIFYKKLSGSRPFTTEQKTKLASFLKRPVSDLFDEPLPDKD